MKIKDLEELMDCRLCKLERTIREHHVSLEQDEDKIIYLLDILKTLQSRIEDLEEKLNDHVEGQ